MGSKRRYVKVNEEKEDTEKKREFYKMGIV